MFEKLKEAVSAAVAALKDNSEHRISLVSALEAAHEVIVSLESRVAALEAAAGTVATVVDAVTGATQVETKAA
jgi:hypothetical protein